MPTPYRVAAALPEEDDTPDGGFGELGGTRAAGVWIVNALSARMEVESTHAGERWSQSYERAVSGRFARGDATAATGTIVRFWPDPTIFGTTDFAIHTVARRLQQRAFLNSSLTLEMVDERLPGQLESRSGCHSSGLTGYVEWVNRRPPLHEGVIHFSGGSGATEAEVAMQWNEGYSADVHTFVNNIATTTGPSAHEKDFRDALVNVISAYAQDRGLLRDTEPDLSADDVCEGLARPVFEDRVGARLVDPGVKTAVQRLCENHLMRWLEANPAAAEAVTRKAIHSADYARTPRRTRCYRPRG